MTFTIDKDNIGFITIFSIFFIIIIFLFVWLGEAFVFDNKFKNGEISLETYCERFKTSSSPPVSCYEYFNVKQNGTRQDCKYNATTKTTNCKTVPILTPNESK